MSPSLLSPSLHASEPRVAVACRCRLGEEVIWDARSGSLIWVDIENPAIWRHWPSTGASDRHALDEKIGFALLTPDPDIVVAGLKSGVVRLRLSTGEREPLVRPHPHPANNRLNSGNVGPDGALYFSTMDDAETDRTGTFHRWNGTALQSFGGMAAVTNGPVVSPDGTRLYTVDTASGLICRHTLDGHHIGNGEPLIRFEAGDGHPDGLTLDTEGHLWVCHYGGARITRFSPDGKAERVIAMPTPRVTKCAFGGPDLRTLYIATALRDGDPGAEPLAGHLFTVETEIRGFAGNLFGFAAP